MANAKFPVITCLYNEKNSARMQEYLTCLDHNLKHPSIEQVHIIYDQSKDDGRNEFLEQLKKRAVSFTYVSRRPSYQFCFALASMLYPERGVILCNADIAFNNTLSLLDGYDLSNTFLALTRWNVRPDGKIQRFFYDNGDPAEDSQDTWIFKTPLCIPGAETIQMGVVGCDNSLAYVAHRAGLNVKNPCLTIQCCHLHLVGVRDALAINPSPYPRTQIMLVPWSRI